MARRRFPAALAALSLLLLALGGCEVDSRDSAADADAKSQVRRAQTAIETYAVAHRGSYAGATARSLAQLEPGLELPLAVSPDGKSGYALEVTSTTSSRFAILRKANGALELRCEPAGSGGCPSSGDWGSEAP